MSADSITPGAGTPTGAPVPAYSDAHHALSEFHAFQAIASLCGDDAATAETGAPLRLHAVRLAAVLGDLIAEHAVLREFAASSPEVPS